MKKSTFKLTNTALFFVAAPLRFSYECFCLKYSEQFATELWREAIKRTFPPTTDFVTAVIEMIMFCVFAPIILAACILLVTPLAFAEFAAGLLIIIPAIAIAVTALPVIALLALGELIASLISNCDNSPVELSSQEFALS